jgi:hypothetical protein
MITLEPTQQSRTDMRDLAAFFMAISRPGTVMTRAVGDTVRDIFDSHFRTQGYSFIPWGPLRPRTIAERIKQGYGGTGPILQRTGKYRKSFTVRGGDNYERTMITPKGWRMEFGSEDFRVNVLEAGRRRPTSMVARPVTLVGPAEKVMIGNAIIRIINRMVDSMHQA